MSEALYKLRQHIGEIADLKSAASILEWDQETYMPDGASEVRATQVATLRKLAHQQFSSDETAQWLDEATAQLQNVHEDSDDVRMLKVWRKDFERAKKLPSSLVFAKNQASGRAKEAWKQARATSNFAVFAPHLEALLEHSRAEAAAIGYEKDPYDALLDAFEPGLKTADVTRVFHQLREDLVPIVQTIGAAEQPDDAFLFAPYDEQKQWDFGMAVLADFGYDFNCGRQDRSAHPFTTTFATTDVRITTRLMPDFLPSALYGTLHECGHALYEQGIDPKWNRTLLNEGTSLGMHESQSRLWENQVGRSHAFWQHYYARLQAIFPETLGKVDLARFYRALNKVQPSLIRVEADEVTYPLHIMLRFELETALIKQEIAVADLPEIWRNKMQDYLGVVPQNDGEGVLQDIHWSFGAFGYFPTYALGTLISSQLYEAAERTLPDLSAQFSRGEFLPLREWLRQEVHQFGRKYTANEILEKICGSGLDAAPWIRYIKAKYAPLYGF